MKSQPETGRPPREREIVRTYNADNEGHYVEEFEVLSVSDDKISLKHLSTRRYSGVTEGPGTEKEYGKEMIDYLSIPTDAQWEKHWRSSLAFSAAVIRGTSMKPWLPLAEGMDVPKSP